MMHGNPSSHAHALAHYLGEYRRVKRKLPGATQRQLHILRETAVQQFSNTAFPTLKHPDWRDTSLVHFLTQAFSVASPPDKQPDSVDTLHATDSNDRLVFLNGHFSTPLSQINTRLNNVVISNLASILQHHPERLPAHWNHSARHEKNSFISLNTSFMQDGAYIYLPADTTLAAPIELVFITSDENSLVPIRNIIIAEKNSHAVIIERYISPIKTANRYFMSSVTECFLAPKSHVEHYKLIEEGDNGTHIGTIRVEQQEKSQFSGYSLALTGTLIRSDTQVKLCQSGARCHLKGLYYAKKKQHIDHQTLIEHVSPHTESEEFYKGIIDDQARAVFNGKLIVCKKAIKSSATQLNKNLLLSTTAAVVTKPQLEIFVDDIQCSHGASIGQLDETALFYLRARGLSASAARAILVKAFVCDIVQQMPLISRYATLSPSLNNLLTSDYATI